MALTSNPWPYYQAIGTAVAGTGAPASCDWPTHIADDIGFLTVHVQGGQTIANDPTGSGWALVDHVDVSTGVGSTHVYVYWKRAASSGESGFSVGDSGDHQRAQIITFRNCVTTGTPYESKVTNSNGSAGTTVTAGACTPTDIFRTLVDFFSVGLDSTGPSYSAWANADTMGEMNLAGATGFGKTGGTPTERMDGGTSSGTGGVVGVGVSRVRQDSGALAATTATVSSAKFAAISILLIPATTTLPDNPYVVDMATQMTGGNSTSHTVDLPEYEVGDLLVVGIKSDTTTGTWTATGWTQLEDTTTTTTTRLLIFYKVADGSEGTSLTVTTSSSIRSEQFAISVANYRSSSFIEAATAASGSVSAQDPPSITPSWGSNSYLIVPILANDDNSPAPTSGPAYHGSGWGRGNSSASGGYIMYDWTVIAGTTEDPGAWSTATNAWIANTIAIRPPDAGGGGGLERNFAIFFG